jgi:hypothetical protein
MATSTSVLLLGFMSIFGMGLTMSAGIGVADWAFIAGMSSPHAMATHDKRDFFKD